MASGIAYTPEEVEEFKAKIISAFVNGFNVTLTAAMAAAGVSKSLVYEWRAEDDGFSDAIRKAQLLSLENGLDLAESKLMKKVNEEDRKSIFYFLDRKGGARGYNPKVTNEMTGPGGAALQAPRYILDFTGNLDEPTPALPDASTDKA